MKTHFKKYVAMSGAIWSICLFCILRNFEPHLLHSNWILPSRMVFVTVYLIIKLFNYH